MAPSLASPIKFVLNAHGWKTSNPLKLAPNQIVVTPAPVNVAFESSFDHGLEAEVHNGKLLGVTPPGKWTAYNSDSAMTDVIFNTGKGFDNFTEFANKGQTNNYWKDINPEFTKETGYKSENWGYFKADQDAALVINRGGNLVTIKGPDIATYLLEIKNNFQATKPRTPPPPLEPEDYKLSLKKGSNQTTPNSLAQPGDIPVFLSAPQAHKIKIFSPTTLEKVYGQIGEIYGSEKVSVIVATCNDDPKDPNKKTLDINHQEPKINLNKLINPDDPSLDTEESLGSENPGLLSNFGNQFADISKQKIHDYFKEKTTDNTLKDVEYVESTKNSTGSNLLGQLRSTSDSKQILANITQNSINCPISKNLSEVQQNAFVTFLEMKSSEASSTKDNKMPINAKNFAPDDLNNLLKSLRQKDPQVFVDLKLPEPENCTYGKGNDKKAYTKEEYKAAQEAIANYNKFLEKSPTKKSDSVLTTDTDVSKQDKSTKDPGSPKSSKSKPK